MATLGLGVGGGYAAGQLAVAMIPGIGPIATGVWAAAGAALGATAGGYIDRKYVYPALFGNDNNHQGPQVLDLQAQLASEGSPIAFVQGLIRIAGTVIWVGPVSSVDVGSGSGGKGGSGANASPSYRYFADVAVAVCEGPSDTLRIFADNNPVYYVDSHGVLQTSTFYQSITIYPGTPTQLPDSLIVATEGSGTVPAFRDLCYVVFRRVALSMYGNRVPNFTFLVQSNYVTWFASGGAYTNDLATVNGSAPSQVTSASYAFTADDIGSLITFTDGTNFITSTYSIVSVSGGVATLGAGRFTGNTNCTNGYAASNGSGYLTGHAKTLKSGITRIATRGGLDPAYIDVSRVTDANVYGYAISGPQPPAKSLEPLMMAWLVDFQEHDGMLYFFTRDNRTTITVSEGDLGARISGDTPPASLDISEDSVLNVPTRMDITYIDVDLNYQQGGMTEKRVTANTNNVVVGSLNMPLAMPNTFARGIARRVLWEDFHERMKVQFYLPPTYSPYEGDYMSVSFNGFTYGVRAQQVDNGANGVVSVSGVVESSISAESTVVDGGGYIPPVDPVYSAPSLQVVIMDMPYCRGGYSSLDSAMVGVYVAVADIPIDDTILSGNQPDLLWHNAEVWLSFDGEITYVDANIAINTQSNVGKAITVLGPPPRDVVSGVNFSVTTGTFVRAAGTDSLGYTSFVTDGFTAGDTITCAGFTNPKNNGQHIITAVSSTVLTVLGANLTTESAGAGKSITRETWMRTVDYTNTVNVEMYQGTLSSATGGLTSVRDHFFNHIWIGNELVGYITAALISTNKYQLSGLIRGSRNTPNKMEGNVTAVATQTSITISTFVRDMWTDGTLWWTSGANTGTSSNVTMGTVTSSPADNSFVDASLGAAPTNTIVVGDTCYFVPNHKVNEPVACITNDSVAASIKIVPIDAQWIGTTLYMKVVPAGYALSDVPSTPFIFQNRLSNPWEGVGFNLKRDGSNNVTVNWYRHKSAITGEFKANSAIVESTVDSYIVQFVDPATGWGAIKRVVPVSGLGLDTLAAAYSAANQTTDGLTPGNPVWAIVYEVGVNGNGEPKQVVVP